MNCGGAAPRLLVLAGGAGGRRGWKKAREIAGGGEKMRNKNPWGRKTVQSDLALLPNWKVDYGDADIINIYCAC